MAENSNSNSGPLIFIVGGLVVAVAVLWWLFVGGDEPDAGEAATDAAEQVEDAAEGAAEAVEDAADDAANAAEGATDNN